MNKDFLPMTREELSARGCEQPDFVYISGDAYVDHPSFGPALLCRLLEAQGLHGGADLPAGLGEPGEHSDLGEPRLGFLISSGNMDSMVNHYTVAGKRRSTDAYTPGGKIGKTAGSCSHCVQQSGAPGISPCGHYHRRHRGFPSPDGPL